MAITTTFNPAGQLVTKITKNNTTLSYFVDKFGFVDIYATTTDLPKKQLHRNTMNLVLLNSLISRLNDAGNIDLQIYLNTVHN